MRKINLFLLFLTMGMVTLFTSCEPTEDALGPKIQFFSGTGLITADAEVNTGETVSFSWQASKGDANLTEFTIRVGALDVDGWPNTDIDKDKYEDTFDTVFTEAGTKVFTFIAEDKDGMQAIETITIEVKAALISIGTAQLGAGSSSLPSYYSVSEKTAYNVADAKANASKVDFVFTSTASEATFKSPKDAAAQELIDAGRTTKYAVITTAFEDVTTTEVESTTLSDDAVTVVLNDVVVFETEGGAKGVFEVTQLTVAADGSATIDIKVK